MLIGPAAQGDSRLARESDRAARESMVRLIGSYDAGIKGDRRPISLSVLDAMRQIPRHLFVPAALRDRAYENRPLPIGDGQTISQPFVVALMTDLLEPEANDVVLEIGTGSAYQAAVLSKLVHHVYTIEIVEPLAAQATKRLSAFGYRNVTVRQGDGYAGWPEFAPFDGIIVTAGADHIPEPLIKQLKTGGRLVIPVGPSWGAQQLILIEKDSQGRVHRKRVLPVMFVPLTGGARE